MQEQVSAGRIEALIGETKILLMISGFLLSHWMYLPFTKPGRGTIWPCFLLVQDKDSIFR